MKKILIHLCCFSLLFLIPVTHFVFAVDPKPTPEPAKYEALEPIPGLFEKGPQPVILSVYLGNVFKFGIGLAGLFAVLMIVIGGFEYVLTEKIASKEEAKSRITGAIGGLILALMSYVLLYTINPDLVNIKF